MILSLHILMMLSGKQMLAVIIRSKVSSAPEQRQKM